ncbi:hypothetical protein [Bacillus sp. FJAT-44742]|uniref:hypothetical protein n=1 Tax=Bacillus sp. FJAT-44742 TaxID=2014005 RepID=UPI000C251289|nr:hypothetical protein [Bacillus sp. FJAT-44742]
MSKIDEIKNKKRTQNKMSPSQALNEPIQRQEGNNISKKEDTKKTIKEETKIERKRVSFDLSTRLHKKLKMQAIQEERNIYEIIEDALEDYLKINE